MSQFLVYGVFLTFGANSLQIETDTESNRKWIVAATHYQNQSKLPTKILLSPPHLNSFLRTFYRKNSTSLKNKSNRFGYCNIQNSDLVLYRRKNSRVSSWSYYCRQGFKNKKCSKKQSLLQKKKGKAKERRGGIKKTHLSQMSKKLTAKRKASA